MSQCQCFLEGQGDVHRREKTFVSLYALHGDG